MYVTVAFFTGTPCPGAVSLSHCKPWVFFLSPNKLQRLHNMIGYRDNNNTNGHQSDMPYWVMHYVDPTLCCISVTYKLLDWVMGAYHSLGSLWGIHNGDLSWLSHDERDNTWGSTKVRRLRLWFWWWSGVILVSEATDLLLFMSQLWCGAKSEFHWSLFLRGQLTISEHWFR